MSNARSSPQERRFPPIPLPPFPPPLFDRPVRVPRPDDVVRGPNCVESSEAATRSGEFRAALAGRESET